MCFWNETATISHLRSEWSDTNTGTNEQDGLVLQEILGSRTEGTVNHDTRKDTANRVSGGVNDSASSFLITLLPIEVTSYSFSQGTSEISNDTDVDRDVIFLRGTITS